MTDKDIGWWVVDVAKMGTEVIKTWAEAEELFPTCSVAFDVQGGPAFVGDRQNTLVCINNKIAVAVVFNLMRGDGKRVTSMQWIIWKQSTGRWSFPPRHDDRSLSEVFYPSADPG